VWCNRTAKANSEVIGYAPTPDQRIFIDEVKLKSEWGAENHVGEGLVYVFEEEGRVVAYVVILVEADAVELDNIDVAGTFQRRGIGRTMVDFVEGLARKLGKSYVTLGTSRSTSSGRPWKSYDFWLRLGYVVDGEIQTDEGRRYGFTEIRFRKKITSSV